MREIDNKYDVDEEKIILRGGECDENKKYCEV